MTVKDDILYISPEDKDYEVLRNQVVNNPDTTVVWVEVIMPDKSKRRYFSPAMGELYIRLRRNETATMKYWRPSNNYAIRPATIEGLSE